jgi:transcription-repair coupling factor (superfamily II helicase)
MTARVLHGDLSFYYPEAALYPAKDLLFYQADIASNLLDIQRLRAFRTLTGEKQAVVVLPASALMDFVSTRESFTDSLPVTKRP